MAKFDLQINELGIELGMPLDVEKLKEHKIKKAGLFTLLILKSKSHPKHVIYWAKSCNIACFNNEFYMFPMMDTNLRAEFMF